MGLNLILAEEVVVSGPKAIVVIICMIVGIAVAMGLLKRAHKWAGHALPPVIFAAFLVYVLLGPLPSSTYPENLQWVYLLVQEYHNWVDRTWLWLVQESHVITQP